MPLDENTLFIYIGFHVFLEASQTLQIHLCLTFKSSVGILSCLTSLFCPILVSQALLVPFGPSLQHIWSSLGTSSLFQASFELIQTPFPPLLALPTSCLFFSFQSSTRNQYLAQTVLLWRGPPLPLLLVIYVQVTFTSLKDFEHLTSYPIFL